jgi:threonine synthase
VESGSRMVMCASTGNTSASAAAYAAYLGLDCIIIIPAGHIALGKLAQAIIYGAKIISLKGNFDQALSMVRDLTSKHPVSLVNSINPDRIEGQKTAAFEGNAGNITAYWQGFKEYHSLGRAKIKPQMMGYQAEGAAPIVRGYPIENPETIASAIRIGNPASWQKAVVARDESGGRIDMVSDTEILAAYHLMASKEGIFGEPASAASVAGLIKMARLGVKLSEKRVVCVITGNGLKDVDVALKDVSGAFTEVPAEEKAVERALGW